MPRTLTVGSLFAGIGGFDLGFERAGLEIKFQVEIDPFCRAVLAKHWPHVERFEDVRTVGAHNLRAVDVLCGGFPCQDISSSGPRIGITGAKSGLWTEYLRLIRQLRPRFVVVENVSDIVHRGLGVVLGDLAASGYDAEWRCISASRFGLPQTRDRMWIIADTCSSGFETSYQRQPRRARYLGRLDDDRLGEAQAAAQACAARTWRADDGLPGWMDRMHALGNAVAPQITEWIGRRLMEAA
jgi:DNA (cytosine-5)-methyltransferase 1